MLGRREFLLATAGLVASNSCLAREQSLADPFAHGAVGDGRTDDRAAVEAALKFAFLNGLPFDGGESVYAINGSLGFTGLRRPWIRSLRLKQLASMNGLVTLRFTKCQTVRIDRLEINVGSVPTVGDMNSTFGLWIDGGSDHTVRNVEAFGDGKNSLIAIWNTSRSIYEKLTARDAKFDDAGATDDLLQGIWLYRNTDCVLSRPVATNLTGNASYPTMTGIRSVFANLRTRGIALGGNTRVSVVEPVVRNVDQGIDITGSDGNIECSVRGGRSSDCGSVGVKLANSAVECKVIGHVAERIGMYGFMASGPAGPGLTHKTHDCDFIDCTAIDVGYNGIEFANKAGFIIRTGDADFDYPKGIRVIRCRAIDRQSSKTMKYGFYSEVANETRGAEPNELVDCKSEGHIKAPRSGRWRLE